MSSGLSLIVCTGELIVPYLPYFVAATERADAPLSRSVCVRSLRDIAGDLEEGSLLCPVRALWAYLDQSSLRWFGPRLCSYRRVLLLLRFLRTLFLPSCERFSRVLGLSGEMKALPCELTAFEGCPPLLCFCIAGRFLRCWRPQL